MKANESTIAEVRHSDTADDGDKDADISVVVRTVISVIRHNYQLIAGTIAAVLLLGVVATLLMTPKYQAVSQIQIDDQADQIIEGVDLQQAVTANGTERFLQTQIGLIKSRALAAAIIQDGKLDKNPAFFEALGGEMPTEVTSAGEKLETTRLEKAINLLLESLVVSIPVDSRIATITITTRSADLSAKLANSYAENFIEYTLNRKYNSSSYARRFLADQLQEAREKLTQSERDLNQYARAASLIRVSSSDENKSGESALSVTNNQLVQINAAAADATAHRIAMEQRWKALANKPALEITEVNTNVAVMDLVAKRAETQAQLAQQLTQHREDYATVKAKRAEVAEFGQRIQAIANSIKQAAETNYEAAVERERSLRDQVVSLSNAALKEQDQGVQYSVLKRVADTNRTLYESLLSRYNQLNASAGASANNITIVDKAVVPQKPSSPRLLLNILISLVLGVLLAAAIVTLKELLDDAIRSPDDVERKLGLRLLGLIPANKDGNVSEQLANRRSGITEAYRALVTNLNYSTPTGFPKVLAVTSAREGEGKSTTSWAVATDIALLGRRTLIVDCDLRRPTLHRATGDQTKSGLPDFLIGAKTIDEVIRPSSEHPSLSYVTGVPIPPDPGQLLAGPGIAAFIEQARERFDVIVMDCPPLLGLSDVPLLVQHADGLLFVIDASSFHRGAVKSALRRLHMANARLLGVALNRFEPKSGSDDYAYYAYNYYNYGTNES